ncbi:aldolase/citrate lyase family protein [Bremerella sp. JC770]|uniref:HpcH/HpaI aldolase family protein n=1 Tax=Bremerella sp. JC770 TaxID=3232137 RepID=UPI00345A27E0
MNSAPNNILDRLRSGQTVIGSWIHLNSPMAAEAMAQAGFDFLTIDLEHAPIDLADTFALFQAIRSGSPKCSPLVRLAGNSYHETKRFLDAGASGVIVPLVRTADEAIEIVRACKYPPQGERGLGFCRDNRYGRDVETNFHSANDQKMVCVQIEHIEAVDNIDDILSVDGVDAAFIGPYDLSASMGIPGQFDHLDYQAATKRILQACQNHQVAPGVHVVPPNVELVRQKESEGYRLIAYSLDITLLLTETDRAILRLKTERTGD